MGRVSKKTISTGLRQSLQTELSELIISLNDKQNVEYFLNEFLTHEEKIMLGKRLVLYMMLLKGFTNDQIHSGLAISKETIRLYRSFFESKSGTFRKLIEKRITKEKLDEMWRSVGSIFKPLSLAIRAKSNMKARAKLANGDW